MNSVLSMCEKQEKGLTPFSGGDGPRFCSAYLFVTSRCNLACSYCYVPQDRPADVSEQVIRWTGDFLVRHSGTARQLGLALFGGEPLLAADRCWLAIDRIGQTARRYGKCLGVTLVTNGLLLTPDLASEALRRGCMVHVSFDGPDDTERRFSGGGPSYPVLRRALTGLRPIIDRHRDRFFARITVGQHNLHLVRTVSDAMDLGFRTVQLATVSGAGSCATDLAAVALGGALETLAQWYVDRVHAGLAVPCILVLDEVMAGTAKGEPDGLPCCEAGSSQLAVAEDGTLYFCNGWYRDARFVLGQLPAGPDPSRLAWLADARARAYETCRDCPLRDGCCNLCWKDNLVQTGDLGTPAPANCDIAQALARAAHTIRDATGCTTRELSRRRR